MSENEIENETSEMFPDGVTPIDKWFYQTKVPALSELGKQYVLTQHNILDDGKIHTKEIQQLIDTAAADGGGVIVVPAGTYLTGSLYFKQGVHLYVAEGGTLKGSDNIADYDICETRMEGETCPYFVALINADGVDGFTMCGPGTIDGNGLRAWKAFWLRRKWNPICTNKDEQRPRLVYISNSTNVLIADLNLQNAHYWTTHLYKCDHVKYINCRIFSPASPVKAPSTDAIDIDVCTDVLVKGCYLEVNDDSVVLKGGKGPWADTLPENGSNERIIIEDCTYGFCHGCLTCGSESVHNRNIIMRRVKVLAGNNLLWLKMRPDTPQHYEYITLGQIEGKIRSFVNINPWTQFYDLKDRQDIPLSYADHVTIKDCAFACDIYLDVAANEEQYQLSDFTFRNLKIRTKEQGASYDVFERAVVEDVEIQNFSPLDYALQSCDTMMRKFDALQLPPRGRFHYHQGVFLSGMYETYRLSGRENLFTYIKSWVDSCVDADGNIREFDAGQLDDIQPGILLFPLYEKTGDARYKKALDTLLPIIRDFPRNAEGGFWHKESCPEQMWLDGLYMAGPICAEYGAKFKKPEYLDIVTKQVLLMQEKTRDGRTGLWYHAWDCAKKQDWADSVTGLSPEFWGRSIGWVPVAVLDELQYLPEEHPDYEKLRALVRELLEAVCRYQSEDGRWYQVVDKGGMEGNWLETSCSCLYVAAICRAVEAGILPDAYLAQAKKGYEAVIRSLEFDGENLIVGGVCIGTGVGDYRHYCERPTSVNDLHGVGAFLLMCAVAQRSGL